MIFMIRLMGHQLHEDSRFRMGGLREIQEEIMRGEYRREHLENQLISQLTDGHKKLFLPKLVRKTHKITTFYLNKT